MRATSYTSPVRFDAWVAATRSAPSSASARRRRSRGSRPGRRAPRPPRTRARRATCTAAAAPSCARRPSSRRGRRRAKAPRWRCSAPWWRWPRTTRAPPRAPPGAAPPCRARRTQPCRRRWTPRARRAPRRRTSRWRAPRLRPTSGGLCGGGRVVEVDHGRAFRHSSTASYQFPRRGRERIRTCYGTDRKNGSPPRRRASAAESFRCAGADPNARRALTVFQRPPVPPVPARRAPRPGRRHSGPRARFPPACPGARPGAPPRSRCRTGRL